MLTMFAQPDIPLYTQMWEAVAPTVDATPPRKHALCAVRFLADIATRRAYPLRQRLSTMDISRNRVLYVLHRCLATMCVILSAITQTATLITVTAARLTCPAQTLPTPWYAGTPNPLSMKWRRTSAWISTPLAVATPSRTRGPAVPAMPSPLPPQLCCRHVTQPCVRVPLNLSGRTWHHNTLTLAMFTALSPATRYTPIFAHR
mmetsp:Transcript_8129/g.10975  ORF Transcript_8129/g.10975 Transcript_8129/m.10975 type:complete len:203 (-) Transcript_8129:1478-2086(-)